MTDDLLYQRRRYLFLGHHRDAGVTGIMRLVSAADQFHNRCPVGIIVVAVNELLAVGSMEQILVAVLVPLFEALRKKLCKNNQLQKNDFVVRAADRSLFFLFQYKLNTAVCQAPDTKYPDATERSEIRIFCGGISSAYPDTLSQAHRALCPSPEAALSISWISPLSPDTELLKVLYRSEIRFSACSDGDSRC